MHPKGTLDNSRLVSAVDDWVAAGPQDRNRMEFLRQTYGLVAEGSSKPKGAAAFYAIVGGEKRPSLAECYAYANVLGMTPEEVGALVGLEIKPGAEPPRKYERHALPSAPKSVAQFVAAVEPAVPPVPVPVRPAAPPGRPPAAQPQMSFALDQNGRASLRVSVDNVPLDLVMRAMTFLVELGIVKAGDTTDDGT